MGHCIGVYWIFLLSFNGLLRICTWNLNHSYSDADTNANEIEIKRQSFSICVWISIVYKACNVLAPVANIANENANAKEWTTQRTADKLNPSWD